MNLATVALRQLATRLLAHEAGNASGQKDTATHRVCARFNVRLSRVAGPVGYRSLLSRALALAQIEASALSNVTVSHDGKLEGLEETSTCGDKDEMKKAGVVLVAQFLGLLHALIGERLTMQLVMDAWPGASLDDEISSDEPSP
ncbi:MAG: hypothetical protein ABI432_19965 [Flavobacteriales bacterium]